jgi:hypothetical protein
VPAVAEELAVVHAAVRCALGVGRRGTRTGQAKKNARGSPGVVRSLNRYFVVAVAGCALAAVCPRADAITG